MLEKRSPEPGLGRPGRKAGPGGDYPGIFVSGTGSWASHRSAECGSVVIGSPRCGS